MIRLDSSVVLQAVLSGAVATTQPAVTVCASDQSASGYAGLAPVRTALNSTTDVTILSAPAASTIRDVDLLQVYNRDTASVTVTIKFDASGVDAIILTVTLATLETLEYTHSGGFKVLTASGAIKSGSLSVAGSSGDVQYNGGSNTLAAEAAFNYNASTNTLQIDNVTIGVGATIPTPTENDNDTSVVNSEFVNQNIADTYSLRGNNSTNNSGTPNTQFDLDADVVVLRNTSNHIVVRYDPGSITNNVSTAGPAENGRDQSGAFSASSWIHFYWIWNGTTLATLSSAVAPTTGPTLPSTYTHWAYCGAVRFNGSSQLIKTRIKGSSAFYEAPAAILASGTATSETAVDVATVVPPNAEHMFITPQFDDVTSAGGAIDSNHILRIITGVNFWTGLFRVSGLAASADAIIPSTILMLPNIGQNFYYLMSTGAGTGRLTIYVQGYQLPNGGE